MQTNTETQIRRFNPGTLEAVRTIPGFSNVRMIYLPEECSVEDLKVKGLDLYKQHGIELEREDLTVTLSHPSQAFFLEYGAGYTRFYTREEEAHSAEVHSLYALDDEEPGHNVQSVLERLRSNIEGRGINLYVPEIVTLASIMLELPEEEQKAFRHGNLWTVHQSMTPYSDRPKHLSVGALQQDDEITNSGRLSLDITHSRPAGIPLIGLPDGVLYRSRLLHSIEG